MIGPSQGVIPDTRPPGYMSGPSFGMLGPSRVLFVIASAVVPSWPAGYYAMGRGGSSAADADPFQCYWTGGQPGGQQATLQLESTHGDPVGTVFLLTLTTGTIPTFWQWKATRSNFVWPYTGISMTPNTAWTLQIAAFRRLAEWVDITELPQTVTWLEGPA